MWQPSTQCVTITSVWNLKLFVQTHPLLGCQLTAQGINQYTIEGWCTMSRVIITSVWKYQKCWYLQMEFSKYRSSIVSKRQDWEKLSIFVQATENGMLITSAKPECKITIFTKWFKFVVLLEIRMCFFFFPSQY